MVALLFSNALLRRENFYTTDYSEIMMRMIGYTLKTLISDVAHEVLKALEGDIIPRISKDEQYKRKRLNRPN